MTSQDVFDLIERVAATSSKNEKESLVKEGCQSELFRRVMEATYNQLIAYNVGADTLAKITDDGLFAVRGFDDQTWKILADLASGALSGNAAFEVIRGELAVLDKKSAQLFRRVLLKDMRAGFSESTVNKAHPGLVPEFPYMRCSLPDKSDMPKWDWTRGVFSQEKADGMFANVNHLPNGVVNIHTRQGSPFPAGVLAELESAVRATLLPSTQTHGELLVFVNNELAPREIGNGILNSLLAGGSLEPGQTVVLQAWDQIPLEEVRSKNKFKIGYAVRLRALMEQLNSPKRLLAPNRITLAPTKIVRSKAEAIEHYREFLRKGKEGTILKHADAIWKDGTSKEQVKLKLEVDVDLVIKAIVPGRTGTKNEGRPGSLTCETSCGQLRVDVTVKNEALRNHIEDNPDDYIGRITAVRANMVMAPSESNELHSLFLPRMVEAGYRTDKTVADSLEEVRAQFDAAVAA